MDHFREAASSSGRRLLALSVCLVSIFPSGECPGQERGYLDQAEREDSLPPSRVLVTGASWSDRMGGVESAIPFAEIFVRTNKPPGHRVFDQLKQLNKGKNKASRNGKGAFDLDTRTQFYTNSYHHHDWIKSCMPRPGEIGGHGRSTSSYDIIFALDLFYKDVSDFLSLVSWEGGEMKRYTRTGKAKDVKDSRRYVASKSWDELEALVAAMSEEDKRTAHNAPIVATAGLVKERKARAHDIVLRFAANSKVTWVGYGVTLYNKDKGGGLIPVSPVQKEANAWFRKMLSGGDPDYYVPPDLAKRLHYFDIDRFYHQARFQGRWEFSLDGNRHETSGDEILQGGNPLTGRNWHPNYEGNKLIANVLMDRTLDFMPRWRNFWSPIEVDEDLYRLVRSAE